jgi:hypothetical protein
VSAPVVDLTFAHEWQAEILSARPLILPPRHFTYPQEVEEVERGALEIMVRPAAAAAQPFLATCALGFRDPAVPTGVWSSPNPHELCAVSGGYAYLIDTSDPQRFTMLPFRPVLQVLPALSANLLLFVGHRTILASGAAGESWESPKLSDEGVTIHSIEGETLQGLGWNMITDKETPFTLDLRNGSLR